MSTHNICFDGKLTKIFLQLSLNTPLLCFTVPEDQCLVMSPGSEQCTGFTVPED